MFFEQNKLNLFFFFLYDQIVKLKISPFGIKLKLLFFNIVFNALIFYVKLTPDFKAVIT